MRLWVDDMKDPILAEQFGLEPDGWTWVKTSQEAYPYLFAPGTNAVTELALDNDLGLASSTDGREIAKAILASTLNDPTYEPPAVMTCISFNPIAEDAIKRTFADIRTVMAARG